VERKLNDVIQVSGMPPLVRRPDPEQGNTVVDIHMCGSYHLRGSCNSRCKRHLDHAPHDEIEDQALLAWCTTALA